MRNKERWYELCEQAAYENDPAKLIALVKEIDRLLGERDARLKATKEKLFVVKKESAA